MSLILTVLRASHLEKAMAPHSSTLAWKIPWTEEPGGLQSMGVVKSQTRLHFHFSFSCIGEGNGNPLQCSCLENPRDGGAWWLPSLGLHRIRHDWSDLAAAAAELPINSGSSAGSLQKMIDLRFEIWTVSKRPVLFLPHHSLWWTLFLPAHTRFFFLLMTAIWFPSGDPSLFQTQFVDFGGIIKLSPGKLVCPMPGQSVLRVSPGRGNWFRNCPGIQASPARYNLRYWWNYCERDILFPLKLLVVKML